MLSPDIRTPVPALAATNNNACLRFDAHTEANFQVLKWQPAGRTRQLLEREQLIQAFSPSRFGHLKAGRNLSAVSLSACDGRCQGKQLLWCFLLSPTDQHELKQLLLARLSGAFKTGVQPVQQLLSHLHRNQYSSESSYMGDLGTSISDMQRVNMLVDVLYSTFLFHYRASSMVIAVVTYQHCYIELSTTLVAAQNNRSVV